MIGVTRTLALAAAILAVGTTAQPTTGTTTVATTTVMDCNGSYCVGQPVKITDDDGVVWTGQVTKIREDGKAFTVMWDNDNSVSYYADLQEMDRITQNAKDAGIAMDGNHTECMANAADYVGDPVAIKYDVWWEGYITHYEPATCTFTVTFSDGSDDEFNSAPVIMQAVDDGSGPMRDIKVGSEVEFLGDYWRNGRVTEFDEENQIVTVEFDDGDVVEFTNRKEIFTMLQDGQNGYDYNQWPTGTLVWNDFGDAYYYYDDGYGSGSDYLGKITGHDSRWTTYDITWSDGSGPDKFTYKRADLMVQWANEWEAYRVVLDGSNYGMVVERREDEANDSSTYYVTFGKRDDKVITAAKIQEMVWLGEKNWPDEKTYDKLYKQVTKKLEKGLDDEDWANANEGGFGVMGWAFVVVLGVVVGVLGYGFFLKKKRSEKARLAAKKQARREKRSKTRVVQASFSDVDVDLPRIS